MGSKAVVETHATAARPAVTRGPEVRIGFVPLLDAAPLILAQELGYFADEALAVTLWPQIGWGNVRDKLVYGHLHASHALVGMPPVSVLRRERFGEAVTAIMGLSRGGSAITLGRRLLSAGVASATSLAEWVGRRLGDGPPVLGHVFGCSMHHYLLREWLAEAGIDPDRDVRLGVLPPPQMVGLLGTGYLDGFCVGEPWNTAAERAEVGRIVAATDDILPAHPEKVLAANRPWLARNADAAVAVVRAVIRACAFCHDPANARRVAEVLTRPGYLDAPADVLEAALVRSGTAPDFDPAGTFPSATHAAWVLGQMRRWDHLPPEKDLVDVAARSVDTTAYRWAAESLAADGLLIACPPTDFPPMRLRRGYFTPGETAGVPGEQTRV